MTSSRLKGHCCSPAFVFHRSRNDHYEESQNMSLKSKVTNFHWKVCGLVLKRIEPCRLFHTLVTSIEAETGTGSAAVYTKILG